MKNKRPRAISLCISIALILFLSGPVLSQQQAAKKDTPQGTDIPIEDNQAENCQSREPAQLLGQRRKVASDFEHVEFSETKAKGRKK